MEEMVSLLAADSNVSEDRDAGRLADLPDTLRGLIAARLDGLSPTERRVLVLAAELRPGDSGAALVDADGAVVGMAFAIAPDRAGTAYALHTDELRAALDAARSGPVHTDRCLT